MQEKNTEYLSSFAFRLNGRAEHVGLSQADIAERLNAKPPRVNHWFKGHNLPRSRERAELVKLLKCTADWLFDGQGSPEGDTEKLNLPADAIAVRSIPVISWAHAGAAANYDEMPKHFQGVISTMSRDRRAFALTIEGDSMEPKFLSGDRVVLEPSGGPINGKPVVAKFVNDSVQLRIFFRLPSGKIRLSPINQVYPAIEHSPSEFAWIFPVVELNRSMF